jgi:prophage tail gpP-like protein
MTTIPNGSSEIDTVSLALLDYGGEIKNWEWYSFNQKVLVPTSGWEFAIGDGDPSLLAALVPGARVQLRVNNNPQCTGYLERKHVEGDTSGGTHITIAGRDILGPVVTATVDPRFRFAPGLTIVDVLGATLKPFGITTFYNADLYNRYLMSGYQPGASGSSVSFQAQIANITEGANGSLSFAYTTASDTQVLYPNRPDLKTLPLQQAKPHAGEGVYAYLERLLRRLGYYLWAMADGSGVVVDQPDFASTPNQKLVRKSPVGPANNIIRGGPTFDLESQPSCIVATGFGGGQDTEKSKLRIIMINELTGLDDNGTPLPEVQAIQARYPTAKVLPLRSQLASLPRPQGDPLIAKPFFLKDDESKNLAQLEAFTRREMANRQQKALSVTYEVLGHTQDGHPWTVNTLAQVDDDVGDVHENMWVLEKTFTKSVTGGTLTKLQLIRPYTLQLSA